MKENKMVIRCLTCRKGMFDGERVLCLDEDEVPGKYVCEDCLDKLDVSEFLALLGRELHTAKECREYEEEYTL